jgi:hypothetical protein
VQHFATDSNLPPRKHTPRNSYHRSIGATHLSLLNRCHPPFATQSVPPTLRYSIGANHLSQKPPLSMVLGYVTESMARSRWVPTTFWKNPALLAIHHRSIGAIHLLKSVPPSLEIGATHLSKKPPVSRVFGLCDRIDGEISLGNNHFLEKPCIAGNSSSGSLVERGAVCSVVRWRVQVSRRQQTLASSFENRFRWTRQNHPLGWMPF